MKTMSQIKPTHYWVHLEPDLKLFTFHGLTRIDFSLSESTTEIRLNAKELKILKIKLNLSSKSEEIGCSFELQPEKEELVIKADNLIQGVYSMEIEFDGTLNDMLYGFYRSRLTYNGKVTYMATTQFEERDARAAFPCFDEPALKATFDLEFLIPENLKAVANTDILEEKSLPEGKKIVKFERTPIMSTYLLYFGVGEFEFLEDSSKSPKLRIVAPPGKAQYGKFALDIARKSFDYGEKFFQAPYPISKCDFIVVEDFAAGAMENYGAITFRENLLLAYPNKTSKPQMVAIAAVVAHEITHMWFGDLVSPARWKYIWLNESFATYFTSAIPDYYFPEWKSWESLIGGRGLGGFARDALKSTVPIELPGDQEINIDASSAPIIYAKGALIMRILEGYIGEEKFFQGIRHFLQKFAFNSATSDDCWAAFEEATNEPITEFANSWVKQEGYPFITVSQEENTVILEQHRFTMLPMESQAIWFIPLKIRVFKEDGTDEILKFVMKSQTFQFDLPSDVVTFKLNADQTGFYRVKYSVEHFRKLGEFAKSKQLNVYDRFGLQNDYFNFMQRGDYSIEDYLAFLRDYYSEESSALGLSNIASNLVRLELLAPGFVEKIKETGRLIAENGLELIGYLPKTEEIAMISQTRNDLLWMGGHFGSEKIKTFASKYFQTVLAGETISPDIFQSIVRLGAEQFPDAWDYMESQVTDPNVPEAVKQYWLAAFGSFNDPNLLKKALDLNLTKIPKLNRAQILIMVARNPIAKDWIWKYYHSNFQQLMKELPKSVLGNTLAMIPPIGALTDKEDVLSFLDQIGKMVPPARGVAEMAAEIAELYSTFYNKHK